MGFRGLEGFRGLGAGKTARLDAHKKPLMWPWAAGWLRMPGERHAGPPRKSLDAHKKPLMWPWDACWLRMPGERHAGPPRKSLDAHKKPLMWPWDACWLSAQKKGFRVLEGLGVWGF